MPILLELVTSIMTHFFTYYNFKIYFLLSTTDSHLHEVVEYIYIYIYIYIKIYIYINLLGGFKIKVISAFHPVEVDQMSTRNSPALMVKNKRLLQRLCSLEAVEPYP